MLELLLIILYVNDLNKPIVHKTAHTSFQTIHTNRFYCDKSLWKRAKRSPPYQFFFCNFCKRGNYFFLYQDFLSRTLTTGQQRKGRDHLLFHSTTSTRSWTFRRLFALLHVRWLSHIFNRTACIYQTATRCDFHLIELPFDWLMMWH